MHEMWRISIACISLSILPCIGASVQKVDFNTLNLDDNPQVVTNVSLDGLATYDGVSGMVSGATNDLYAAVSGDMSRAIGTNNPAFVAAVTNCPVVIAAADASTLGEFGEYGTLGALLAAIAAAITWLKTNKANASDVAAALAGKEDVSNKTASFSPTPGDVKYPTEKLVKDSLDANEAKHRYDLVTKTPALTAFTYSGSAAGTGRHWEAVYHSDAGGYWSLYAVADGFTYDTDPTPVYADTDAGDTAQSDDATSLTFSTASVTATRGWAVTLADRAINAVSLSAAATLTMPAAIAGHARDLVVRLTVGEANLGITWGTTDADGVAVDYETEDGEFPDLSAAGTYLVRLTETAAFAAGTGGAEDVSAKFLIQCQPLQTAAAGGAA